MPYFRTSQEWLDQTLLLLEARPETTRITTKHRIKAVPSREDPSKPDADKPPRASIIIKTYDPASGVTLKYKTTKAAEVGRLMGTSLRLAARSMGGLPQEKEEDVRMEEATAAAASAEAGTKGKAATAASTGQSQQSGGRGAAGGGGTGGRKRKGKK